LRKTQRSSGDQATVIMPASVRDNTALSRFELDSGGVTAYANYRLVGNVITIMYTETPLEARGRGIASLLVAGVLDSVRARGLKIVPQCPFGRAYIAKHPEYRDLLA
jgi:predicted GNAT family acetyltransferase